MCDIAFATASVAPLKEIPMSHTNLDSIVRSAAANLEEEAVKEAKVHADVEIDAECWNRNDRLNMIAYEDQQ